MIQQIARADLHAVAKSNRLDVRVALHIARENCHRVGVIEKPRVGADFLNVAGKILQHMNRPQAAENAADAERVGNRLAQAVLFRNFKVDDRAGIVKTDLNRVHHKIRAAQSIFALFHAEILANRSLAVVDAFVHLGNQKIGLLQTFRVDVIKGNFHIVEFVAHHGVANHIFGKYGASRTHKGQLHRGFLAFS